MDWLEVKIITVNSGLEIITGLLFELGITSIQIEDNADLENFINENKDTWDYVDENFLNSRFEDTSLIFYIKNDLDALDLLQTIKNKLANIKNDIDVDLGSLEIKTININEEEWINNWKKHYKPFKLGNNIVVKPFWEKYDAQNSDVVFTIDPGNAFGTGMHETTKLCVTTCEEIIKKDDLILDLGCGSGILSVIALLLGGKSAIGIDIEKIAVESAINNSKLNDVSHKYTGIHGNILEDEKLIDTLLKNQYNIIFANIIADIIIPMLPIIKKLLHNNGKFIASGIIENRKDEVVSALEKEGFIIEKIEESKEWNMILSKKGDCNA